MFRALSTLLLITLFYVGFTATVSACQWHTESQWVKDHSNYGEACDLGDEPVKLSLIDYVDLEREISYRIDWHQDLADTDCQQYLHLTIAYGNTRQPYKICNQPFPFDQLTHSQLTRRLARTVPLFQQGNLNGIEILQAIANKI